MKIEYKYNGVSVDVNLESGDMGEVNPYDIVTRVAELAHVVCMKVVTLKLK